MNPPKTTTNNPTYPPNHPQLIFTYPASASSIPPPQTQHTITQSSKSSFHPSSSSFLSLSKPSFLLFPSFLSLSKQPPNPTVECLWDSPVLNSYNSSLIISTISFSYKSHTFPLTPLSAYPATKPSKRTVL